MTGEMLHFFNILFECCSKSHLILLAKCKDSPMVCSMVFYRFSLILFMFYSFLNDCVNDMLDLFTMIFVLSQFSFHWCHGGMFLKGKSHHSRQII